jgi:Tol biopolymer transport system component/class 3 adenylate cyclase
MQRKMSDLQSRPARPSDSGSSRTLEIAHVLFTDIVGYSKLPMDEQEQLLMQLQCAVRETPEFRRAEANEELIRLPTGDGMALVFFRDPEAPVRCAVELSRILRDYPGIQLRMGIHSGPVYRVADINANRNVAGGGINIAQRVMDCGDAGHVLVSNAVAEVIGQLSSWRPMLHDLGEVEVKHGLRLRIYNLYTAEAGNPGMPTKAIPRRSPPRLRLWDNKLAVGMGALVLVCLVLAVGFYWWRGRSVSTPSGLTLEQKQISFVGDAYMPAISPDGNFVTYISGDLGDQKLMMQALSGGPSVELLHGDFLLDPRWSPNGSELLLKGSLDGKTRGTFVLARLGGTPRRVADYGDSCWSADGSKIISARAEDDGAIFLVDKSTGVEKSIPPSARYQRLDSIDCSPKTNTLLLFTEASGKEQIWTMTTDGSDLRKLVEGESRIGTPRWSATGDAIYYLRPRGDAADLVRVPVSGTSAESSVVVSGLRTGGYFTLSDDGSKLAYTQKEYSANLWSVETPASGAIAKIEKTLTSGTLTSDDPSISPDGRWVAFVMSRSDTEGNIYKMSIDGGQPTQLTFFDAANSSSPAWSPDGRRIAFIYDQGGIAKIWTVNTDGSSVRPLDKPNPSDTNYELAWAPSAEIIYQQPGLHNLRRLNVETQEEEAILPKDSEGWLGSKPIVSPDGKEIALYWNRPDTDGVWVIGLEKYSERFLGPRHYCPFGWSPDGKSIYAFMPEGGREIILISLGGSKEPQKIISMPGPIDSAAFSPDGRKIIVSVTEVKSDVWLMTNFESRTAQAK